MFEVHNRHTPMFVTSDVRKIAEAMTATLGFDELALKEFGIEINPIFQTVRINEKNEFIVRSQQLLSTVQEVLKEDPVLGKLRARMDLTDKLVRNLVERLGVDSYLCTDGGASVGEIAKILPVASAQSKKPLLVVGSSRLGLPEARWVDLDHPALWISGGLMADMSETEAFFSILPALKMEVSLNRFQTLESFGDFAAGMIRF